MAVLTDRFILRSPIPGDMACLREHGLRPDAVFARQSTAPSEGSGAVSFIDRLSGEFCGYAFFLGVPPLVGPRQGNMPNRVSRKELHLYALNPADEPAMTSAALQWLEESNVAYLIDLPGSGSMRLYHDAPPHVETLLPQALTHAEGMEQLKLRHVSPHALHRSQQFVEYTPGGCLWALCLTPRCSGLLLEAGFLYPHRTDGWQSYFSQYGMDGDDLKLRVIRHVNTEEELAVFFSRADTLKAGFFRADRDAIKAESAARKKVFVKAMSLRARALGLKGRAQNWQATTPDGSIIRLHTETTPYSDWYTIDMEQHLNDPELPPIHQLRRHGSPFGRNIDWQSLSECDLDDMFRILGRDFVQPLLQEGANPP